MHRQYSITYFEPGPCSGTVYSNIHKALATDTSSGMKWEVIAKLPRLLPPEEHNAYTQVGLAVSKSRMMILIKLIVQFQGIRERAYAQSSLTHPNVNPIIKLIQLSNGPLGAVTKFKPNGDIVAHIESTGPSYDVWSSVSKLQLTWTTFTYYCPCFRRSRGSHEALNISTTTTQSTGMCAL